MEIKMRNMRHFRRILTVGLLAVWSAAAADNYAYLSVNADGNSASNYAVTDISKITFENSNMVMWNGDSRMAEFALATLDKMFFSSTNGIQAMSSEAVKMRIDGGVLRVTAPRGTRITLYNIGGQLLKEVTASGEETEMNLSGLRQGAYIVKVGEASKKFLNK